MAEDQFLAMIDQESEKVEDLLHMTSRGCYRRLNEDWEPLDHTVDDNEFEGLWALEVDEDIIDVFDAAEDGKVQLSVQDIADFASDPDDLEGVVQYDKPAPVMADGSPNMRGVHEGLKWFEIEMLIEEGAVE